MPGIILSACLWAVRKQRLKIEVSAKNTQENLRDRGGISAVTATPAGITGEPSKSLKGGEKDGRKEIPLHKKGRLDLRGFLAEQIYGRCTNVHRLAGFK